MGSEAVLAPAAWLDADSPLDLELAVLSYATTTQAEGDELRTAAGHGSVEEDGSNLEYFQCCDRGRPV